MAANRHAAAHTATLEVIGQLLGRHAMPGAEGAGEDNRQPIGVGRERQRTGGIGAEQLPQVLETGVGSIAVVRALVDAPDPEAVAAQWMQRMAKRAAAL